MSAGLLNHPGDVVVEDKGLLVQLGQGDLLAGGQGGALRARRPRSHPPGRESTGFVGPRGSCKGQLHRALPQPLALLLLVSLPDGDGDAGIEPGEVRKNFRQPKPGDGGEGGQGDGAHGQAPDVGGLLLQLAAFPVQLPEQGKDLLALLGGPDPRAGAKEQGEPKFRFQGFVHGSQP